LRINLCSPLNFASRTEVQPIGLGKEIWDGIDPDEYVAKERDSWDG